MLFNRKRKPTKIKKNEIRVQKDNGHPAYVYLEQGENAHIFSITHAEDTKKKKNIKLPHNPNRQDKEPSFALKKTRIIPKQNLKKKKANWKMSRKNKDKLSRLKT